jgi:hypothetical protein
LEGLTLQSARLLSGGEVKTTAVQDGFVVDVPKVGREKIVTTVELVFDGPTLPVKPLQRVPSLTRSATLRASCNSEQLKNLTDQDAMTSWKGSLKKGEKEMWIEADFEKPVMIGSFSIARGDEWSPKHTAEIQIPDGSKGWKTISPKNLKLKWETMKFLKKPVTTDRIRLRITDTKKFVFAEFELFPPLK